MLRLIALLVIVSKLAVRIHCATLQTPEISDLPTVDYSVSEKIESTLLGNSSRSSFNFESQDESGFGSQANLNLEESSSVQPESSGNSPLMQHDTLEIECSGPDSNQVPQCYLQLVEQKTYRVKITGEDAFPMFFQPSEKLNLLMNKDLKKKDASLKSPHSDLPSNILNHQLFDNIMSALSNQKPLKDDRSPNRINKRSVTLNSRGNIAPLSGVRSISEQPDTFTELDLKSPSLTTEPGPIPGVNPTKKHPPLKGSSVVIKSSVHILITSLLISFLLSLIVN